MKWLALACLIAANIVRLPAPVVRTSSGLVRGRVSDNGKFYEYFGLPYGVVDDTNRFRDPMPPPKWNGIFFALNENIWCPQETVAHIYLGEPNCLKLNVYTPVYAKPDKPLPVMVFIHGGCFVTGTGSPFLYGGDFFVEQDVVFVGLNYRLNVEGFLCLGIKEAPGNAGLRDQIAALKWIQQNIRAFGGDPDNVTLFGESAGAVSTSIMILSPLARGLFHRAILQSGSSLAPWALQHDPIRTASQLVKKFGYDTRDPHEIYRILSKKTAKEIVTAIEYTENNYCVADVNIFVPCIEDRIDGVEPVLTEYPADIIKSSNYTKVPMIIGFNDNEGLYFVSSDYGTSLKSDSMLDVTNPLQTDLEFPTEFDKNITAERIRDHYFSTCHDEKIMNMVDLYSDYHFKFPQVLESQLYAQTNDQPLYFYLFRYSGLINMPKIISGFGLRAGASHADELFYMFKPHSFPLPHRYLESHMIQKMVTLWTNFAKHSDPSPPNTTNVLPFRWYPSWEANPTALVIDDQISTTHLWDHVSVAFWNDTYNKYRRKAYRFRNIKTYT